MSTMPATIQAGDTLTLDYANADYPASAWSVVVYLRGISTANITLSASGDNYTATVAAATTAAWSAGIYQYSIVASAGGVIATLETGYTEVKKAVSAIVAPVSNASHVKTVLDAIEAIIAGRASVDQEEVTINNRTLKRTPIPDLLKLRSVYKAEYDRELRAAGLASALNSGNQVRVRL